MKFQKAKSSYKDRAIFCPFSKASSNGVLDTRLDRTWEGGRHSWVAFTACSPWPLGSRLHSTKVGVPLECKLVLLEAHHMLFLTVSWFLSQQNLNGAPTITTPVKTPNHQDKQHPSQVIKLHLRTPFAL